MNRLKKDNSNRTRERERESKLVIWALFDDAKSCYKNAIEKNFNDLNIEVHSIGINDVTFSNKKNNKYFYHKIDLSITNFNLINELNNKCKSTPDVILASPPCESWSTADCDGKMLRHIDQNCNWIVKNKKFYDDYNSRCHKVKRRYFEQKEISRLIGEATIGGTIKIINHFKPKIWIIENPQKSLTWKFQKFHWDFYVNKKGKKYYENLTYYSSYNKKFSLKPTIFKSNIKLDLKKTKGKTNKDHIARGSYSKRSSIPFELINDIMFSIFKKTKFLSKEEIEKMENKNA